MNRSRLGVMILAAGSSSRLGRPKQLLEYQKTNLLDHTIQCALSISDNVFVVLGANALTIQEKVELSSVEVIVNPNWAKGIGNSIAFGVGSVPNKKPEIEALMILLSDQPKINHSLLSDLNSLHGKGKNPISACNYGDTYGVPVIFDQSLFGKLQSLEGDKGAKRVISSHLDQTNFLDFPEGKIDIDTEGDLKFLE